MFFKLPQNIKDAALKLLIWSCIKGETAGAQWLGCCATNRKVTSSILDGTIGIFY